ncbi:MAG: MBL fold metallo-hydrolase [Myxococcales bacterium]|nr:MBL fold metallo-hydrolase [Myxococcales bacterium]
MIRWILRSSGVLLLLAAGTALYVYVQIRTLEVDQVTPDIWVIYGLGGNVGVLRTDDGTVMVDTMMTTFQGRRLRERAEALAGGPIHTIINTHYHSDHTHGNPAFAAGTSIVATERTLDYLRFLDAGSWSGDSATGLPNDTFKRDRMLRIGGKTLHLLHPGPGHTGGDLVVLFVEDRVLHAGDLLFHRRFPVVDLEGGGSFRAWSSALAGVLLLDFDRVIPGHGTLAGREELRWFGSFITQLWDAGERAAAAGWSLEETLERAVLLGVDHFEPTMMSRLTSHDRDYLIRRVWEEATGAVTPTPLGEAH